MASRCSCWRETSAAAAAASPDRAAAWTEEGELFTFGDGDQGQLGHGGKQNEHAPRLVESLVGKKVVGASIGSGHTAVFGFGLHGELGHGPEQELGMQKDDEYLPRLVAALQYA